MGKLLLMHPEKCVGCRTCEIVCSLTHADICNPASARISVVKYEQLGINLPLTCANCEDPVCTAVCPTGALSRQGDQVEIDYDSCVGCRMCVMACPVGGVSFDPVTRHVIKCDQCGGDPQCVKFCPQGAIEYVDEDALAPRARRNAAERLLALIGPGGER